MKLYDSKLAPNARRVRIFLAEKGMSVPMVDMDLARLDQKTTAFSVLNPFQTVPVLELDDGEVISKSAAICGSFEELRPEPPLFGVGALGRTPGSRCGTGGSSCSFSSPSPRPIGTPIPPPRSSSRIRSPNGPN